MVRRGVSDYMIAPVGTLDIIRTVSGLFYAADAKPVGRTLAVVGAKGGVGASTVAHNIAWSIARDVKLDAVVADLDLPFGTAGPRLQPGSAAGHRRRRDVARPHRYRVRRPAAVEMHRSPEPARGARDARQGLRLRRRGVRLDRSTCCASTVPCIVLDVPHVWTGWARRTLIAADDILIVAAPDLANLRNTKNLIDLLRGARPNDGRPQYCLNMVGVPKRPEIKIVRLRQGARIRSDRLDPVRTAGVRHRRQQRTDDRRGLVEPSRGGDVPLARTVSDRPHRSEAVADEPAHPAYRKAQAQAVRLGEQRVRKAFHLRP